MIAYLLDTNILSETARPRPDLALLERLREHEGELATASVVWHELHFGVARLPAGRRREELGIWLERLGASSLVILPYDVDAAVWHARERARQEAVGRVMPFRDSQIAAVAWANRLTVVTANMADFAGLEGIRVENWLRL